MPAAILYQRHSGAYGTEGRGMGDEDKPGTLHHVTPHHVTRYHLTRHHVTPYQL
jgi:hypothetical protein